MFDFSIFQTNAKLAQDAASQFLITTGEYTKTVMSSTAQYTTQVQEQVTEAFKPGMEAFTSFFKKG